MKIYREMNSFIELYEMSWSGATDTLDEIIDHDKENELMNLLEDIFEEATATEINDFLWFDREYIYETLEMYNDENKED